MKYHQLGKSDLQISEVGFGCMSLHAEETGIPIIRDAIDRGINFFDTSDLYNKGMNEELVGRAIAGRRGQVILATKTGNVWKQDGSGWEWKPSASQMTKAIEGSLRRLNTDYIDLYQLHGGTLDDPIDEIIETFERLRQSGKIRFYGISSIRPNVIRRYIETSDIVSVMSQYSLLDRRPEESVLSLLESSQVGMLARGSLAQGLLIDKLPKPYLGRTELEVRLASEGLFKVVANVDEKAVVAIRFALQHAAVTSAIVGVRTVSQLKTAIAAAKASPLDAKLYVELKQLISPNTYSDHR